MDEPPGRSGRRGRPPGRWSSLGRGRLWAELTGALVMALGAVVVFGAMLALAGGLMSSPEGPPSCDGQVMEHDDTCAIVVNGYVSSTGDYQEMERRKRTARRDGLVFGGIGLTLAAVLLLGGWRLKRRGSPDHT